MGYFHIWDEITPFGGTAETLHSMHLFQSSQSVGLFKGNIEHVLRYRAFAWSLVKSTDRYIMLM